MRNTQQKIVKGLLLFSVLSVYIYASGATLLSYQIGNQNTAELAQANELSNAALKLYNAGKHKDALEPAKQALEIRERMPAGREQRRLNVTNSRDQGRNAQWQGD